MVVNQRPDSHLGVARIAGLSAATSSMKSAMKRS